MPLETPSNWIYLDGFSTTPCDPRVVDAMAPFWTTQFANPNSPHGAGRLAAEAVGVAREEVAAGLGARPQEIVFTSGATEACALAITGVARWARSRSVPRKRIVVGAIEHKAVLEPCRSLAGAGFEVCLLPVTPDGVADESAAHELINDDTLLVCLQAANNELGTLQPVARVASLAHERGALVFCDAAQAVGKIGVDVGVWDVDFLSLCAHKFYGPKGVGALWARGGKHAPLLSSWPNAQESGFRAGTSPVPLIVGLGEAMRLARKEMPAESERLRGWRDRMEQTLRARLPCMTRNGGPSRLPHGANWRFADIEADAVLAYVPHLMLSTGAACDGGTFGPSPVLQALGLNREQAAGSLRLALTRFNTWDEIERATRDLGEAVERVQVLTSAR